MWGVRSNSLLSRVFALQRTTLRLFLSSGVLETSLDDFENGEEVYEAIGGILHEIDAAKAEQDVRSLCDEMMRLLKPSNNGQIANSNDLVKKVLDAPIQLGSIVNDRNETEIDSIWLSKKDDAFVSFYDFEIKRLLKLELLFRRKPWTWKN